MSFCEGREPYIYALECCSFSSLMQVFEALGGLRDDDGSIGVTILNPGLFLLLWYLRRHQPSDKNLDKNCQEN